MSMLQSNWMFRWIRDHLDRLCQEAGASTFTNLLLFANIHSDSPIAEIEADCRAILTELNHDYCPIALGRGFAQKFPLGLRLGNSAAHLVTLRNKVWFTSEPAVNHFPLLAAALGASKRIGKASFRPEYFIQPCTATNEYEAYNHIPLVYIRGLTSAQVTRLILHTTLLARAASIQLDGDLSILTLTSTLFCKVKNAKGENNQ